MPELVYALDVANYAGPDLSELLATHRPQHVICRLSLEDGNKRAIAVAQLRQVLAWGLIPGGYGWPYFDDGPNWSVSGWLDICAEAGVSIPVLWIDAEENTHPGTPEHNTEWLRTAGDEARRRGVRPGIYTRADWWNTYVADAGFGDWPLWVANYNGQPTLDGLAIPMGWDHIDGHQWSGDPDRSVFLPEVCAVPAEPVAPAPPQSDVAGLVGALSYIADDVAPKAALSRLKKDRVAALREIERVRRQYLGDPAA